MHPQLELQHLKTHRQDYQVPLSQEQAAHLVLTLSVLKVVAINLHIHSQDLEAQGP